ncbi:hypothetical protein GLAREA_02983 [Glarea lozoyensis ATCC 20868]|uniref:Uncharacterized protein n=1 Tax=Glarea lozoyensis (strain ATCC 20868 / MF5171) TaxID=1116229 RepID=S3CPJ2_GLAL2|nr:uncharacterized protein GLAREA_02983 [Glarea lozoyensis ATCC 20868]EPE27069.1 hypothetical protein GLAREA_02983 [Glarea lozoyensis ATCC 20868]
MLSQSVIIALLAAYGVAIPLNINLGAYSPALVVGDGEISFGGKADVANLMNALEGAAVSGAAANGQAQAAPAPAIVPAATPSASPITGGSSAAAVVQPAEEQQSAQIASLQGMGKEIAPRVVTMEADKEVLKRDLSGFNAALKFATDALTKSPEVQLGTPAAGVGIIVKPGSVGAKPAAAAGEKKKRQEAAPKLKTTVTTMFVRGGPRPAGSVARSPAEDAIANLAKREPSPAFDGLSLNMAEGQVAELTFIETRAVDGDEDEEDDEE